MVKFTITGRPLFDVQVEAADEEEAAQLWHAALHALSEPSLPAVAGVEIVFFTDEGKGGAPITDLYVDRVDR